MMTQRIDVSNLAATINGGDVEFVLSAWLGGYASQNDTATVIAHFLDGSNNEIGMSQLGPVTAADRDNATKLLFREQFGELPTLARYIEIELTATRATGENDGYADNISLALLLAGDLDFNGIVNAADWSLFRAGQHTVLSGLSRLDGFQAGDLNGDFQNNHADFLIFKTTYESANGLGSFANLTFQAPEPTSSALAALAILAWIASTRGLRF